MRTKGWVKSKQSVFRTKRVFVCCGGVSNVPASQRCQRHQGVKDTKMSKTPRCQRHQDVKDTKVSPSFAYASMRRKKSRSPAGETKRGLGEKVKKALKSMKKFS